MIAAAAWSVASCAPNPPPFWAEGGATLVLTDATWKRNRGEPVIVGRDGKVSRDGDLLFQLDGAGRVFDEDNEPIAVLAPDGYVVATNDELLGRVGLRNASPPWTSTAWLRIAEDGSLMLFDSDARVSYGGGWRGCSGPAVRTCTLVSHLLVFEALKRQLADSTFSPSPVFIGIGAGVWY